MKKYIQLFLLISYSANAQLPETDIWLFKLGTTKKGIILKEGKNVTNREGYDNQPYFSTDNKFMFYTSIRENKQADIFRMETGSGKSVQITKTAVSEYSPMQTPDGKKISVVMVESDSTQRVWSFDYQIKKGMTISEKEESLVTEKTDSIGYYAWLNKDSMLYYKLTDPHSLRVLSVSTGQDHWLCDHPTRAFKPAGKDKFFYVIKKKEENEIRLYNPRIKKSEVLTTDKKENEDYIWDKNLGLVKSEGSKLMRFEEKTKMWMEVADLSGFGIKKITRFAISSNGRFLAIVDNKQK